MLNHHRLITASIISAALAGAAAEQFDKFYTHPTDHTFLVTLVAVTSALLYELWETSRMISRCSARKRKGTKTSRRIYQPLTIMVLLTTLVISVSGGIIFWGHQREHFAAIRSTSDIAAVPPCFSSPRLQVVSALTEGHHED